MSNFAKIILGNIFRNLLTALIMFFVTKNVIEADVASKLMRGETAELWNGSLRINLAMIVNVLVGLAAPILIPVAVGVWIRVKHTYETIVARSEAFSMSKEELKNVAAQASIGDIISAVAKERS